MRSKDDWKRILQKAEGYTLYNYALQIQSDLVGYRKTSLHRADDAGNITRALEALVEVLKNENKTAP
jgi:hypothetical protein